jgi:hypothetical protein
MSDCLSSAKIQTVFQRRRLTTRDCVLLLFIACFLIVIIAKEQLDAVAAFPMLCDAHFVSVAWLRRRATSTAAAAAAAI